MTYSDDGTYVPSEHKGNTVRAWTGHRVVPPLTVTRKGKEAIYRSYCMVMEAIPYEHGKVTVQYTKTHKRIFICTTVARSR